jgi:hypothetical protein
MRVKKKKIESVENTQPAQTRLDLFGQIDIFLSPGGQGSPHLERDSPFWMG